VISFGSSVCFSAHVKMSASSIVQQNKTNQFATLQLKSFGYNSAESEPIWMKSAAFRVYYWGLAPGRFWARSAQ